MLPKQQVKNIIDLGQFQRGLNTRGDFDTLTAEESPDCMDVIFTRNGFLDKRFGRVKLNTAATGASDIGHGLFDYGVKTGVRKLIAKFGSVVYKMDDLDGTFDTLSSAQGDAIMHCAQSRNKLIICREDNGTVQWWDGTAATASDMNSKAPKGKYPIDWQGYLFLGYSDADNPTRFYYEDNTGLDTDDWENYYTIRTSEADELTGWGILKNRLYAFMRNSIHRISYLGGSPLFDVNELITVAGAVPRTIKNIILPTGQEVLIFLTWQKQIAIFDGTQIQFISDNVYPAGSGAAFSLQNVNNGALKKAHAVVDSNAQLYKLFVPLGAVSAMTHCLVLDYKTMALYPFSNQTISAACHAEDSIGRKHLIGSGYTGYSYRLDKSSTDDGTAIDDYYTSAKIGGSRIASLKVPEKMVFYFKPVANYDMLLQERLNFDSAWTTRSTKVAMYGNGDYFLGTTFVLGTATLGSSKTQVTITVNIPAVNNLYQYRISSNQSTKAPWRLYKVEFITREVGVGAHYENKR
jgi:hypothetical protein